MNLVSYIRVSTDDQGESGLGLQAQLDAVTRYAECYGHQIVGTYRDVGSGTTMTKRPGLADALADVEGKHSDAIIVSKLDRIARNVKDLLGMLDRVKIISVGEQFDSTSPAGRLVLTVLGAVGEWESAVIRERTRAAMGVAKRAGRRVGGRGAPFGWAPSANPGEPMIPDPEEQRILIGAQWDRHRGITLARIALTLNAAGDLRRGKPWTAQSVHATLCRAAELSDLGY